MPPDIVEPLIVLPLIMLPDLPLILTPRTMPLITSMRVILLPVMKTRTFWPTFKPDILPILLPIMILALLGTITVFAILLPVEGFTIIIMPRTLVTVPVICVRAIADDVPLIFELLIMVPPLIVEPLIFGLPDIVPDDMVDCANPACDSMALASKLKPNNDFV